MDQKKIVELTHFCLEVNEALAHKALLYAGGATEAFRQFVVETQILGTMTPAQWLTEARNAHWVQQIEAVKQAYDATEVEEAAKTEEAAGNAIMEELKRLRALVEAQAAPKQETKPEASPAANVEEKAAEEKSEEAEDAGEA